MSVRRFLVLLLFLSVAIESTVFALPFVFIISLIFYLVAPSTKTIIYAFATGLLLDIVRLSIIGATPLTILILFLILDLARTRMLLNSYKMILLILFVSTFSYGYFFSYEDNLLIYISVFGAAYLFIAYFYRKTIW